jgi:hypothetical protein
LLSFIYSFRPTFIHTKHAKIYDADLRLLILGPRFTQYSKAGARKEEGEREGEEEGEGQGEGHGEGQREGEVEGEA